MRSIGFVLLVVLLAVGAVALLMGRPWGGWLAVFAVLAGLGFAAIAFFFRSAGAAPAQPPSTRLQKLPNERHALAERLDRGWWQTPIDELHARERADNPLARNWEIQGDQRLRLLVLPDFARTGVGRRIPLRPWLVLASARGTVAHDVASGFSSLDREAPVMLEIGGDTATLTLRDGVGGTQILAFTVDATHGTFTALPPR